MTTKRNACNIFQKEQVDHVTLMSKDWLVIIMWLDNINKVHQNNYDQKV
jgi:hypothetical protein